MLGLLDKFFFFITKNAIASRSILEQDYGKERYGLIAKTLRTLRSYYSIP